MKEMQEAMSRPELQQQMAEMQAYMQNQSVQQRMQVGDMYRVAPQQTRATGQACGRWFATLHPPAN
jgi:D-serine deaminase-like pyridoxal phosphate-dependent protein